MRRREKIELALIGLAIGLAAIFGRHFPGAIGTGVLLTTGCLGWLLQGGVRDIFLLLQRKRELNPAPPRRLPCMCLESTVGLLGLLVGVLLALLQRGGTVPMTPLRWTVATAGVLTLGFLAKDWVIAWRPLSLRRERDHHSIIVTWR